MDAHLQDLRRRATATGALEDRVALLVHELRHAPSCTTCGGYGISITYLKHPRQDPTCDACAGTGAPLRSRVGLAAYVGDEAARAALEACTRRGERWYRHLVEEGSLLPDHRGLQDWLLGLGRWGDAMLVRTAVAAARLDPPCARRDAHAHHGDDDPDCDEVVFAIEAAEAWLADPHGNTLGRNGRLPADSHHLNIRGPAYYVAEMLWQLRCGSINAKQLLAYEVENAARRASEQAVRAAIRDALTTWALGAQPA